MSVGNDKICNIDDELTISNLAANAQVVCRKCGAKAHDKSSVCEPVKLEGGPYGDFM